MVIRRRITIVQIRKPVQPSLNEELKWFGDSLGLFGPRDKEGSCFRVFIELLKATKRNQPMSSDELAMRTELTRGTVVHHLNKMIESGLVVTERRGYILRVGNLEAVIDEVEKDLHRMCDDLRKIAKGIDDEMGM